MTLERMILPYPDFVLNEVIDPEEFDLNNATFRDNMNIVVDTINKLTDSVEEGDSGADNISITPITPFVSDKVQSFFEEVVSRLQSSTDGSSGADFISSTTITGVTGSNVQQQLESLKSIFDALQTQASNIQSQVTSNDAEISNRYTKSEVDSKVGVLQNQVTSNDNDILNLENDLSSHSHDSRYMTRTELSPYLQGGDTVVIYEVFTITSSNNGDGTFTYTDRNGDSYTGQIGDNGEQIFTLFRGEYLLGQNHVRAIVNDTLHRSVASGGLLEVDSTHVGLVNPEGDGTEITIDYFQRIGVSGEHNIIYGSDSPPPTDGNTMWFKVVE